MKRSLLLTFALLLALSSKAQFIFTNSAELAEMQRRVQGAAPGPFVRLSDAGTNSPADWQRIKGAADAFKASPLTAGNTSAQNLQIWTGYPDTAGKGEFYPYWQGYGMACAALTGAVTGDNTYLQAVRSALLYQVRIGGTTWLANWPTPANANKFPTYENGAQESNWMYRLGLAYDYSKAVYSSAERAEIEAWFSGAAWYLANRIQTRLGQSLPARLANNWSTRAYYLATGGVTNAGWLDPIYEKDPHNVYPDFGGWSYTHRNADGTIGNKVPRSAENYNNRLWMKAKFIYLAGRITGDTSLVWHAKCTFRETVAFGSWPDGTLADFERNGNYGIPQQGLVYSCYFYEFAVTLADGEARRGRYDVYRFSTRDGAHGTASTTGQPSKTIFTILDRFRDCVNGSRPIYAGPVTLANRIDDYSEGTKQFLPFSYVLATAGRWKSYDTPSDTSYQAAAYRTGTGVAKYPGSGFFVAGKVGQVFGGSGLEWPGYNFMFGRYETIEPYGRADTWPGIGQEQTVVSGTRSLILSLQPGNRPVTLVYWRQTSGTPLKLYAQDQEHCLISATAYLQAIPVGQYGLRVLAKDAAGARVEKSVLLTVVP